MESDPVLEPRPFLILALHVRPWAARALAPMEVSSHPIPPPTYTWLDLFL
jgi:hypothetical protein